MLRCCPVAAANPAEWSQPATTINTSGNVQREHNRIKESFASFDTCSFLLHRYYIYGGKFSGGFCKPYQESSDVMPNQLCHELSPYLLQHAENPVDWQPWSTEALSLARVEQKPIFLSIGYASCHWCHVMAHESFEDP